MVPLSFAGHDMFAIGEAALYWPDRRAVLLADLHFEKASWYARFGQMLPPYDSVATLGAIERIVTLCDPAEIWCLGDSFHDSHGAARLPQDARDRMAALTRRARWTWITGNHDSAQEDSLGGRIAEEAEIDGVMLRHEAVPGDMRPEISGHFHPKMRLHVRGLHVARRCFVRSTTKLILPAFGSLTGGLDAGHAAILDAVGPMAEALIPVPGRLLCFPLVPMQRSVARAK